MPHHPPDTLPHPLHPFPSYISLYSIYISPPYISLYIYTLHILHSPSLPHPTLTYTHPQEIRRNRHMTIKKLRGSQCRNFLKPCVYIPPYAPPSPRYPTPPLILISPTRNKIKHKGCQAYRTPLRLRGQPPSGRRLSPSKSEANSSFLRVSFQGCCPFCSQQVEKGTHC
jgi:hypothetical protein